MTPLSGTTVFFTGSFDGLTVSVPIMGYLHLMPGTASSGEMESMGVTFELSNVTAHQDDCMEISFVMKPKSAYDPKESNCYVRVGESSGCGYYVHPVLGTRLNMQWENVQCRLGTVEKNADAWQEYKTNAR